MRYLIAFVTLGVVGLWAIPNAGADCHVQRQRVIVHHAAIAHQVVAVKQAVVTPITVAAFAAYPVQVPTYSVGYDPHAGEIQELRKTVRELTRALQGLSSGTATGRPTPSPTPTPTPAPPSDDLQAKALKVITARCAQCHTEQTAKGMGGNFTILRGGNFDPALTTLDVVHLADRAHSGSMPPPKSGPPIPDEEAAILRAFAEKLVKQERQARKSAGTGQP